MESQRSFLIIALALVSFLLWQQWHAEFGPKPYNPNESTSTAAPVGISQASESPSISTAMDVPESTEMTPALPTPSQQSNNNAQRFVSVKTDTLQLVIDRLGGDVVSADLIKFPITQDSPEPYSLLRASGALYTAQSGLIGANGPDARKAGRPMYSTDADNYELVDDNLQVTLTWQDDTVVVTKTFSFFADRHDVEITYSVKNLTTDVISVQQYAQLKQTLAIPSTNMFMPTYRGAAYSTQDTRYEKYSFDDVVDKNLRTLTLGGWVAMLEHYFVSAWVPPQTETNTLYSRALNDEFAVIGYTGQLISVDAGNTAQLSSQLYLGPKDQEKLAQLARGLDLTVDYGILWWISQPLFTLLKWLHNLVGNWGLAIVLITIIVKGAMYWLTKKQYESMAKMRNLAPKMQQLKDRFGDDRQKMSHAMMELYKKEKVNPMGGCLPLLLQMPIFLALYWVLLESVELRHAEFYLWITDLSIKDPYFVLPVLTGASMYLLQKLQPTTITDPMQQKIMQWMPVAMSIFFLWFPAGLVLYWLISNVITLVQAKLIYASMEKRGLHTR